MPSTASMVASGSGVPPGGPGAIGFRSLWARGALFGPRAAQVGRCWRCGDSQSSDTWWGEDGDALVAHEVEWRGRGRREGSVESAPRCFFRSSDATVAGGGGYGARGDLLAARTC